MHDQNNVFYAIALSAVVLITWQYFFATSFLSKPAAPKTSQARAIAPGIETLRPQTQAVGRRPQPVRTSHDFSRPRGNRHLADRNASPSIRPGCEDRLR